MPRSNPVAKLLRPLERRIEYMGAQHPARLALYVFLGTTLLISGLNIALHSVSWYGAHTEDIFVELHGMLADLLIIGWFVQWLDRKAERRLRMLRYEEEIDDFRGWRSDEAVHRIAGNVKRLNREGAAPNNLRATFMRGANLRGVDLKGADLQFADLNRANLREANLRGANLRHSRLQDVSLQGAVFLGAKLEEATLTGANLQGADLRKANLQGAQMQNANLRGANFEETYIYKADLRGADLRFAKHLTADNLCTVASLQGARLAPELREAVTQTCPELFSAVPERRGTGSVTGDGRG
jgi:hypothetical protein